MRKYLPAILAALTLGVVSVASVPKIWSYREVMTAYDLNQNFQSLDVQNGTTYNALLVVQGVIAANKNGIVDAWARTTTTCTSGTCALSQSFNVTSVTFASTGVYNVTLSYTPTANTFTALVTPASNVTCVPSAFATTAPQFVVTCNSIGSMPTVANAPFSFIVLDNNHSN